MLVCALIVPRVAWGAHEAGHDQPVAAMTKHAHHEGHSHEVFVDVDDKHLTQGGDRDGGLIHDHVTADVLSAMAVSDVGTDTGDAFLYASQHLIDRHRSGEPAATPDSLLRPPRAV